jgi:hypothetical protein
LTIRKSSKVRKMIIIVDGKAVELSASDSALRRKLLRDAARATVARYRPALERLEKA